MSAGSRQGTPDARVRPRFRDRVGQGRRKGARPSRAQVSPQARPDLEPALLRQPLAPGPIRAAIGRSVGAHRRRGRALGLFVRRSQRHLHLPDRRESRRSRHDQRLSLQRRDPVLGRARPSGRAARNLWQHRLQAGSFGHRRGLHPLSPLPGRNHSRPSSRRASTTYRADLAGRARHPVGERDPERALHRALLWPQRSRDRGLAGCDPPRVRYGGREERARARERRASGAAIPRRDAGRRGGRRL